MGYTASTATQEIIPMVYSIAVIHFLKTSVIMITVMLCVILASYKHTSPDTQPEQVAPLYAPATPLLLAIDSIKVQSPIESVGALGNSMATPALPNDVAWYSLGTRPGEIGSAVLAGHVNWVNSDNAAFTRLHEVRIGDTISVIDNRNVTTSFIVRAIKHYASTANAAEVFASNDGLSHLNLITCDGAWSALLDTHQSRLVIFADKQ